MKFETFENDGIAEEDDFLADLKKQFMTEREKETAADSPQTVFETSEPEKSEPALFPETPPQKAYEEEDFFPFANIEKTPAPASEASESALFSPEEPAVPDPTPEIEEEQSLDDFFTNEPSGEENKPAVKEKKSKEEPVKKKKPLWVSILSNVLFVAIIVLMLGGSTIFALSRNADKSIFGYRFYNVLTESMETAVPKGALVIVKLTPPEEIVVGDIITFYPGANFTTYLTHRVIEKHENYEDSGMIGFKTQGDNNPSPDNMVVNGRKVVGIVTTTIPYGGWIVSYVRQNAVLIIVFTGLLALLSVFLKMLFEKKKPADKVNTTGHS